MKSKNLSETSMNLSYPIIFIAVHLCTERRPCLCRGFTWRVEWDWIAIEASLSPPRRPPWFLFSWWRKRGMRRRDRRRWGGGHLLFLSPFISKIGAWWGQRGWGWGSGSIWYLDASFDDGELKAEHVPLKSLLTGDMKSLTWFPERNGGSVYWGR